MDQRAAQRTGLTVVDLKINALGLFEHSIDVRAVEREAEVAVAVHRRDLDAHGVVVILGADAGREIAVVRRDDVGIAGVDRLARCAAGEPAVARHLSGQRRVGIEVERIAVEQGLHLHAGDVGAADVLRHCRHDGRRLRSRRVHPDEPAGLHLLRNALRCRQFVLIHFLKICHNLFAPSNKKCAQLLFIIIHDSAAEFKRAQMFAISRPEMSHFCPCEKFSHT